MMEWKPTNTKPYEWQGPDFLQMWYDHEIYQRMSREDRRRKAKKTRKRSWVWGSYRQLKGK